MSAAFEKLMNKIAKIIEAPAITGMSPEQTKRYETGEYKPYFSLVVRDGELLCVNTIGRRSQATANHEADREIIRIRDIASGFYTDADNPRSWTQVTLLVAQVLKLEL